MVAIATRTLFWNSVPDSFLFGGLMSDDDWGFDAAIEEEESLEPNAVLVAPLEEKEKVMHGGGFKHGNYFCVSGVAKSMSTC